MSLNIAQQTRLRDDLRGLIKGDVRCDEITQQLYAIDASILQTRPDCIVYPRNKEDVIAVVRYASESNVPIFLRGAGTSLTGESLGNGIVLVFSRYMRRFLLNDDDQVTIQPGLLRRRLNGIIGQSNNRRFGPLAGNVSSTSLGSILSRNGAGIHYLRYGLPSDYLVSMTVVLANGDELKLDRNTLISPLQADSGITLAQEIAYGKEYVYAGKIAQILDNRSVDQLAESAKQLSVNRAGYAVNSVLHGDSTKHVDLARLFLGSEGTLGITVEATLKTVSLPQRKCAAGFFFDSLSKAVEAVLALKPLYPVLCELIDRRRLNMVRDWDTRYRPLIPTEAEAAVLVELDAGTYEESANVQECRDRLDSMINLIQTKKQLCFHSLRVNTEWDFQLFDQVIRRSELVLGRMRSSIQPLPLFDDVAVPLDSMNDVVRDVLALFQQRNMIASISGHVGQGHLRIHPLFDMSLPQVMSTIHSLVEDVHSIVLAHRGTISSEWGLGLLKSQFLSKQFPHQASLFRRIKETFDPQSLLNPGKVIPSSPPWTIHLRCGLEKRGEMQESSSWGKNNHLAGNHLDSNSLDGNNLSNVNKHESPLPQLEIQLRWEPSHVHEPAYRCNGCGECLRFDRQSRICPLFRGTATIEYAPRSKADLLRGVLDGDLQLEHLTSERAKEIADTCFHCRMCDIECPSNIDISALAFRSKAAYVAAHGLPLQDLLLSRMHNVLDLFLPSNFLFNMAMRNQVFRWILEKTFQIPQRRIIPTLTHRTYLHRSRWSSRRHRLLPDDTKKEKAALFVDTFVNYFDPQLAELAVQILEHNGFAVHVPPRQRPSGRTSLALGHASQAERLAQHNTNQLSELVRQGYKIVTIESYSAASLKKDYHHLIGEEESEMLAQNVFDFCSFLLLHLRAGKLETDFQPLLYRIGYHAPCCSLAVSASLTTDMMPAEKLLRLIPGLGVQRIEQGCCGMGGSWGIQQKNYRHSLQIGTPLFRVLRLPEIDFGVSDCNTCCLQMMHGSKKPAVHPIRLLAVAYGFLPNFS